MSSYHFSSAEHDITPIDTPACISTLGYSLQGGGMEQMGRVNTHSSHPLPFNSGQYSPAYHPSPVLNMVQTHVHDSSSPEQTSLPFPSMFNTPASATRHPLALSQSHSPDSSTANQPIVQGVTIFVDGLVKDFMLEPQQQANLHLFIKDTLAWLYRRHSVSSGPPDNSIQSTIAHVEEMLTHLEDNYSFNKEQKHNIRVVAQDVLYEKNRTFFSQTHAEIEGILKHEKHTLKLGTVFGNPGWEKRLISEIHSMTSSVKNGFREDCLGSKAMSLATFTYKSAKKYKCGGPGDKLDYGFIICNAILRKLALDLKALTAIPSPEPQPEDDGVEYGEPLSKRKLGRPTRGEDFWGKVNSWFQKEIQLCGMDFSAPAWKELISDRAARHCHVDGCMVPI
ncbi:hypothetical protein CPB84DRAFT_1849882 [Gymnopilus junonius]|uniref:Uncharacterized protein n=1 Tax=Gymnopilus junonius TaxID=109634 RepID=A0A9P5NHS9_GYMJU|nr:hypothetical protein CPB84DRAFT_1849882 [Gymnopilus junonius]